MIVVWLFFAMPWVCLQYVIVVFTDHTHLLFLIIVLRSSRTHGAMCWSVLCGCDIFWSYLLVIKIRLASNGMY